MPGLLEKVIFSSYLSLIEVKTEEFSVEIISHMMSNEQAG
jgi:hypothetical protein